MKRNSTTTLAGLLLTCILLAGSVHADLPTADDARRVAENLVAFRLGTAGNWGGAPEASVGQVRPLKRGDRQLGFFCEIRPGGYVVVNGHEGLPPIQTYSESYGLDPESDQGMADIIKIRMERTINVLENQVGPLALASAEAVASLQEEDYRPSWELYRLPSGEFLDQVGSGGAKSDYQEGDTLLTSLWHQTAPYNNECPDLGCGRPPCSGGDHALVGCVATAGAQILRYWAWPPSGETGMWLDSYDWPNMPDSFIGCTWDPNQVDAVAEICYEFGEAADMDYGCNKSGAYHEPQTRRAYENKFRINPDSCYHLERENHSPDSWWDRIVSDIDQNRPIHYGVTEHAIVCDGWQILPGGERQGHFNYGWGGGTNGWHTMGSLPLGSVSWEDMIRRIVPDNALGPFLMLSYYPKEDYPYRYVDQDVTGNGSVFAPGHHLQFLPGRKMACSSVDGYTVSVQSTTTWYEYSYLFTRGDLSQGARLVGGTIKIHDGGAVKLH